MKQVIRYILISSLIASMIPTNVLATTEFGDASAAAQVESSQPRVEAGVSADDGWQLDVADSSAEAEPIPAGEVATEQLGDAPEVSIAPATLIMSEVLLRGCLPSATACGAYTDGGHEGSFVELYNPSPAGLAVHGWKLQYVVASGDAFGSVSVIADIDVQLDGYGYAIIGRAGLALPQDIPAVPLVGKIGNKDKGYLRLLDETGRVVDLVGWGSAPLAEGSLAARAPDANNSIQRCEDKAGFILDTNQNRDDFLQYERATPGVGIRCAERDGAVEVNECEGVFISEIAANVAANQQFIELYNNTEYDISIHGCQLQTNRSAKTFVLPDIVLVPGSYRAIYVQDTELTLTKTTTGTVSLLSSDGASEVDVRAYANLATDTSWSWFGGDVWQQTYAPTPGDSNIPQMHAACEAGYVRNLETGRCNKLVISAPKVPCSDTQYRSEETGRCRTVATTSGLTPCKDGQYRSEETNRCRNIALAGSTLVPCRDNQYRSEETNRCRLIATAAKALVPCKDNQYRSEETNRCRTIAATSIPTAAFAVEPIADTGKAFVGWWVLGGVGLVAIGYGAWEWRREMVAAIRKVGALFRSGA